MKARDIAASKPGSAFLLCIPKGEQSSVIERVCSEVIPLMHTSGRCRAAITAMELTGDKEPNTFSDLFALCRKLITVSGLSSHFDGLLLLNIADLTGEKDAERLRALGELLDMKDGLFSRCRTVIYGPDDQAEVMRCAELLDFSGRLQAGGFECETRSVGLEQQLKAAGVTCESRQVKDMIKKRLREMSGIKGFDAVKYLRSAADMQCRITAASLQAMEDNIYSYHNRLLSTERTREAGKHRRMGFGA